VAAAVSDLDVVAAAVARHRKNFSAMSLKEALDRVARYPAGTRIGFLFGNERTGLRSSELQHTNFRFSIPQARTQPSYNLASAVLLTLFFLAQRGPVPGPPEGAAKPLPRREQEKCIHRILEKLEGGGFMHPGNRRHMGQSVSELFGRLDMSPRDRDLLLAIFGKAFTPSAGEAKDNKIRS